MRSDMDKVIVERPRFGSRSRSRKKGYRKYIQSVPVEELPRREPLLGRWKGRERCLNEHLGPMRRFLRSNVGRPWNKVHQELCEHVSFNNAVQAHVLTHIDDYVHRYVAVIDASHVQLTHPRWSYRPRLRPGEIYVCPHSGLLKAVRVDKRRRPATRVAAGKLCQFLWRDGAWWEVRFRKLPDNPGELWDVWFGCAVARLTKQRCLAAYGGEMFAISQRPLTRIETKQLYRTLRSVEV